VKDSDGSISGCHKTKAGAQAQLAALYANVPDAKGRPMTEEGQEKLRPVDADSHVVEYGGTTIKLRTLVDAWDTARREHYVLDPYRFEDISISELRSGPPKGGFSIRGYAAVYDALSHNLGGFREKINPGFFAGVLERNPDVHALWDHDTRYALGRTTNGTLDLRDEARGLYNWIKVAPTSYAQDLRILMDRGDIDQASFAFTVDEDEFAVDEDDNVTRTLIKARDLYDVTVTAQGAYPQAVSEVAERAIRSVLDLGRATFAVKAGKRSSQPAIAASRPGDGAAEGNDAQGQAVTKEEQYEAWAMWKAMMDKKAAAAKTAHAKLAARLGRLE
jgi:uncharacterized protein